MKKFKIPILAILVMVISVTLLGCAKDKDKGYYASLGAQRAEQILITNGIEYSSVSAEYQRTNADGYSFYNLVVKFKDEVPNYEKMFNLLTLINEGDCFYDGFEHKEMTTHLQCENNGIRYQLTYECVKYDYMCSLENMKTYDVVYNSIAQKEGQGLNDTEKATIYGCISSNLSAKKSNGEYLYTEEEAFEEVAETFNVSVSFLRSDVYLYDIYEIYIRGY